mmetsp:Transcript_4132/g.11992  ORF Transcript_4132/g.11992 Transcript_4132/m.11992 type:complete len:241 (+) Transcript_4132:1647-2369(+)
MFCTFQLQNELCKHKIHTLSLQAVDLLLAFTSVDRTKRQQLAAIRRECGGASGTTHAQRPRHSASLQVDQRDAALISQKRRRRLLPLCSRAHGERLEALVGYPPQVRNPCHGPRCNVYRVPMPPPPSCNNLVTTATEGGMVYRHIVEKHTLHLRILHPIHLEEGEALVLASGQQKLAPWVEVHGRYGRPGGLHLVAISHRCHLKGTSRQAGRAAQSTASLQDSCAIPIPGAGLGPPGARV